MGMVNTAKGTNTIFSRNIAQSLYADRHDELGACRTKKVASQVRKRSYEYKRESQDDNHKCRKRRRLDGAIRHYCRL
ncbi:MAG: hypothetical protein ACI8VC_001995 [Candidatus Endobugula sp.]|jgi:hypothetical protein